MINISNQIVIYKVGLQGIDENVMPEVPKNADFGPLNCIFREGDSGIVFPTKAK